MEKSLDRKLREIHADPAGSREFIIADAKDADMAFGMVAPGVAPDRSEQEQPFKSLAEYRDQIRAVIRQGIVDIVLMSNSTNEQLMLDERLFDGSAVTPAMRANDASDVHAMRGSKIPMFPAQPFRSAELDHAQCGHIDCEGNERKSGTDLGLYSVTFNNDCELDLQTLNAYREFRQEAERKGFRHFLEVFNPNMPAAIDATLQPKFMNDVIARTLAGVTSSSRPIFLKIVYQGPRAMEELVHYDPHLIVGVLGGAAGTTHDAFHLLYEAKKYGARAALFGRKINQAECQLAFIQFLRYLADGVLEPEEAVRAYHSVLEKLKIPPVRSLDEDLILTSTADSYSERKIQSTDNQMSRSETSPLPKPELPDFGNMTSAERVAWHLDRINKSLG